MKNVLLIVALIAIVFCIPLEVNAKGRPISAAQLKDAYGETVGRVIGMDSVFSPFVLTDQGYRTNVWLGLGLIGLRETWFLYESADCTGIPYMSSSRLVGTVFTPDMMPDEVYEQGMIYYIRHDAERVPVTFSSQLEADVLNPACHLIEPPVELEMYPAELNDPTVTGINNTIYPSRMVIE